MTMYYVLFMEHSAGAILIPGQGLVSRKQWQKGLNFVILASKVSIKRTKS